MNAARMHLRRPLAAFAAALLVLVGVSLVPAPAGASGAADIDQCANGGVGDPDEQCTGANWVNGNLGASKAHYLEGQSVPYRIKISDLAPPLTSHTVTIEWDTTKGGKHALDYLTSYNRTESDAAPCSGVAGCVAAVFDTEPIPVDPTIALQPDWHGTQAAGVFTLFGGTITAVGPYTHTGSFNGDSSASITITFTATALNPVLAWGGHIADRHDWGADNSAIAITGSPFHMRLLDLDGSGGNQDRSLASDAVIFPGSITIVKNATPDGPQDFAFTATGLTPASFALDDDADATLSNTQTFTGLLNFSTGSPPPYTVTEAALPGWTLTGITCLGGHTTVAGRTVSIGLDEGDDVLCTYANTRQPPAIISVLKDAVPDTRSEPGGATVFNLSVTNQSPTWDVTISSLTDSIYGNVTVVGGRITATNCTVPRTILPGGSTSCSFTATINGIPGFAETDVVTASGTDSAGNAVSDSDDAVVTITDLPPVIQVDKAAVPTTVSEPGGNVTFTVTVTNLSGASDPLTLTSLVDDKFGDLTLRGCTLPPPILPGAHYTCTFTGTVNGNAGSSHTNIVKGIGHDDDTLIPVEDADDATVRVVNVTPLLVVDKSATPGSRPEPGGDFTYTVAVTNPSTFDTITLTTLNDNRFDNLAGVGNCAVPQTILPLGTYSCTFVRAVTSPHPLTHTNIVTASGTDDDGTPVSDTDDAIVTITDVLPTVSVDKVADPLSVPEPGGTVTFRVVVTNPGTELIELVSLIDSVYGSLAGKGTCLPPASTSVIVLVQNATYSCSFPGPVAGNAGSTHTNTVTVKAVDDEGHEATDTDDAVVTIANVMPVIDVTKTADPLSVPEPGGLVNFTVTVKNESVEVITLTALMDNVYGDITAVHGDVTATNCTLPILPIGIGATYTCSFFGKVAGDVGSHTNTLMATALDDERNPATDTDDAVVAITNVPPTIVVLKTAAPTSLLEPGGPFVFLVTVTNTSVEMVTLNSLMDNVYGNLTAVAGRITATNCTVPRDILPDASTSCSFSGAFTGNAGASETDVVTASATDNEGGVATDTDDATVRLTDAPPLIDVVKAALSTEIAEPGGDVQFKVTVTNLSGAQDPVVLTSLIDNVFGNLTTISGSTCAVPQTIQPGANYECTFTKPLTGNAGDTHTNIVTGSAHDNDSLNPVTDTDDATVTFLNEAPDLVVDKSATPGSRPEPGGNFTYTVGVTNPNGSTDPITLLTLVDDKFGDLNGEGTCAVPQRIEPGTTYSCVFVAAVTSNTPLIHTNIVTGSGIDDEGTPIDDTGTDTVTITDVVPTVLVDKAAAPDQLPEPGGDVTFTVTVTNPGTAEAIRLSALTDNVYGNLDGKGTCDVTPAVILNPGQHYSCTFSGPVAGNAGSIHRDVVTGVASDDDGNTVNDTGEATATLTDVLPKIKVDKAASAPTIHTGDDVTYTYLVTNPGIEPLKPVTVTDDKCSPVTFVSGDADADQALDVGEVWTYTCTTKLSGTTTNTVLVIGEDDEGNEITDDDQATVQVINPSVIIEKVASATGVVAGQSVTYTYTVTNKGNAPLSNVAVTDDKCSPLTFVSGDANDNTLLDTTEAWTYQCRSLLTTVGLITNIGTVHGRDPIGGDVTSTDTASVTVTEVLVFPAAVDKPPALVLPQQLPQVLPRTGVELLWLAGWALTLIGAGSALRKRRSR